MREETGSCKGRKNCRDVIYEIRINEIKCDVPNFYQAVFP